MESIAEPLGRLHEHTSWMEQERARLIKAHLTLLQACLCGLIYEDPPLRVLGAEKYDSQLREYGWDWPSVAHTMIGRKRLANLCDLTESVLGEGVEGDFIETGVWRGGACILMRGVLDAHSIKDRNVWVADSFEGLPSPDEAKYPADKGDVFHTYTDLSVSLEQVKRNFEKYGLLDDQVKFLKGWFKDTLPNAPIEKLALLRLDGDMYESTMDALDALYDKLSVGGYVIVDDYNVVEGCKSAVTDFLSRRGVSPEIIEIDGVGVYWRKTAAHVSQAFLAQEKEPTSAGEPRDAIVPPLEQINIAYDNLAQELSASHLAYDELKLELEKALQQQERIYRSLSWRVTKPIRYVGNYLNRKD